jgi:DHA2 family multidrug resistance protein-like MFS transporter
MDLTVLNLAVPHLSADLRPTSAQRAPVERAGAASAISETGSELGGALGIAVLGSLGTAIYRGGMAGAMLHGLSPAAAEAARGTLGGAVQAAGRLAGPQAVELLGVAREAFAQAFQVAAVVCAGLTLLAAAAIVLLLREADRGYRSPSP